MSANNQLLVKEHKGQWYIFEVQAESWNSWDDEKEEVDQTRVNELPLSSALGRPHATLDQALVSAHKVEDKEWTEYGVHLRLAKDGADVTIIDDIPDAVGV